MPIKAILETLYSTRDKFGNCYFAFRYTDAATGSQAEGTVSGGESNVHSIIRALGLASEEVHTSLHDFGIRDFNNITKKWKHAGCTADQLAAFVRAELAGKA
jgi:hypothetical protein